VSSNEVQFGNKRYCILHPTQQENETVAHIITITIINTLKNAGLF